MRHLFAMSLRWQCCTFNWGGNAVLPIEVGMLYFQLRWECCTSNWGGNAVLPIEVAILYFQLRWQYCTSNWGGNAVLPIIEVAILYFQLMWQYCTSNWGGNAVAQWNPLYSNHLWCNFPTFHTKKRSICCWKRLWIFSCFQ